MWNSLLWNFKGKMSSLWKSAGIKLGEDWCSLSLRRPPLYSDLTSLYWHPGWDWYIWHDEDKGLRKELLRTVLSCLNGQREVDRESWGNAVRGRDQKYANGHSWTSQLRSESAPHSQCMVLERGWVSKGCSSDAFVYLRYNELNSQLSKSGPQVLHSHLNA